MSRGMNVTINTDDPIFFSVELNDELEKSAKEMSLEPSVIRDILKNGVRSTFLPEKDKTKLLKEIDQVYNKHFLLF